MRDGGNLAGMRPISQTNAASQAGESFSPREPPSAAQLISVEDGARRRHRTPGAEPHWPIFS
jgi:hypothetical protein